MDNGMSTDALIFYAIAAMFIGFIVIGIAKTNSENRYSKPLPNKPELLQKIQQMPEVAGNFDSNSLQTARAMISEVERFPDPTARTLALAEMLHRQKQYEMRQTDRAYQQERKEVDALDRVLALADRLSGRGVNPVFPDPRARRINDYHQNRQLAETEYWNGGYYK